MENENNEQYDYEDESPPSLLSDSGGWLRNAPKKPLFLGGMAALLVILLVAVIFTGGDDSADMANEQQLPAYDAMERMQGRFERLENRIEEIEMSLTRLPGLIHQVETMETGDNGSQVDQLVARMEQLDDRMEEIRDETRQIKNRQQALSTEISERKVAAASSESSESSGSGDVRYHEVKKGDTLYSIARTNGIPLKTLLEKNNLTEESTIMPGQRLIVSE